MTTGISLVRENAESLQPPRTLWVTFPLGRPMGVPGDAAFQRRVMTTALSLLERERGPVLEDFPEDVPRMTRESAPACPVSFQPPSDETSWQGRLEKELGSLKPWYDMGRRRRDGRTLVGVCGESIDDIVARMAGYLDTDQLPTDDLRWFKRAMEDAKAYYLEALTAQPGDYDPTAIREVLWFDTQLGAGLRVFHDAFLAHPKLNTFARIVMPREALQDARPEQEHS